MDRSPGAAEHRDVRERPMDRSPGAAEHRGVRERPMDRSPGAAEHRGVRERPMDRSPGAAEHRDVRERPAHGCQGLVGVHLTFRTPWHDLLAVLGVRRKDSMKAGEIEPGTWHQCRKPGDGRSSATAPALPYFLHPCSHAHPCARGIPFMAQASFSTGTRSHLLLNIKSSSSSTTCVDPSRNGRL